jgi:AhpD family alkylhydroperoxidase
MTDSYKEINAELANIIMKMSKEMSDVMGPFHSLHKAAGKEGVLSAKTKELIALALAIGVRCEGCIGFHVQALINLGVSREELLETLGVAILMGGGPSVMTAASAIKAFEELSSNKR